MGLTAEALSGPLAKVGAELLRLHGVGTTGAPSADDWSALHMVQDGARDLHSEILRAAAALRNALLSGDGTPAACAEALKPYSGLEVPLLVNLLRERVEDGKDRAALAENALLRERAALALTPFAESMEKELLFQLLKERPPITHLHHFVAAAAKFATTPEELMGSYMVGPDAGIFRGRDIGAIPPIPANLMEILKSPCELSNDGRLVAATHRLVLVPASIDGEPLTLIKLRALAEEVGRGRAPSFFGKVWDYYNNEAFANTPLAKSTWVLEYETVAPGSLAIDDAQQVALVKNLPFHRTARLMEHLGALVFHDFENGERIYQKMYGGCEERSASGARFFAGLFDARGLDVGDNVDDGRFDGLGRAVVRKLNT